MLVREEEVQGLGKTRHGQTRIMAHNNTARNGRTLGNTDQDVEELGWLVAAIVSVFCWRIIRSVPLGSANPRAKPLS